MRRAGEIEAVRARGVGKRLGAEPDQAELRAAVRLMGKEDARGREQPVRLACRGGEAEMARAGGEVVRAELQNDAGRGKVLRVQTFGEAQAELVEHPVEDDGIGEVCCERGLDADAARFLVGDDGPEILAGRAADERWPVAAEGAGSGRFESLEIPNRVIPRAARWRSCTGPTPGRMRTGSGASTARASAAPITAKPRGLSRPAASLASRRLGASPIETVSPVSSSSARAKRASRTAGDDPSRAASERSSTASSIESGCTQGVSARMRARTARAAAPYLAKSGGRTTASGQSESARNIGIALRTPESRAT